MLCGHIHIHATRTALESPPAEATRRRVSSASGEISRRSTTAASSKARLLAENSMRTYRERPETSRSANVEARTVPATIARPMAIGACVRASRRASERAQRRARRTDGNGGGVDGRVAKVLVDLPTPGGGSLKPEPRAAAKSGHTRLVRGVQRAVISARRPIASLSAPSPNDEPHNADRTSKRTCS